MKKWKLKRELIRLGYQFSGTLSAPFEAISRMRLRNTDLPKIYGFADWVGRKVAVLVLFQPGGVAESTFQTVRYLRKSEYNLIIVSNAPLTDGDKVRFREFCTDVIERRNNGYDFGAYQDVILSLSDRMDEIERLLLVNDSTWFPFLTNSDPVKEMEDLQQDVVAAQIFGERLVAQGRLKKNELILGSYFLLFSRRALAHFVFRSFWRDYRMTSNKELTIRRGERALSRCLIEANLSFGGLYDDDSFERCLRSLSPQRLREAVAEMVCLSDALQTRRLKLLNAQNMSQDDVLSLLLEASESKNFLGSSPLLCLEEMQCSFIKKNNEMLYRLARQRIASALTAGRIPGADPVMALELRERSLADRDSPDLLEAELV